MKRPWEAGERGSAKEMYAEIRRVGYLMESFEAMQFHQGLINYIICDDEFIFPEECKRHGLPMAAVNYYGKIINQMWSGIKSWED